MTALQEIAVDLEAERASGESERALASNGPFKRLSRWFADLSIGRKIQIFFGGNLAFALLAGLFVVFGYIQIGDRSESIEQAHENVIAAERLLFELSEARRHSEAFLETGDGSRARSALARIEQAQAKVGPLEAAVGPSNPSAVERIEIIDSGLQYLRRTISSLDNADGSTAANRQQIAEIDAAGGRILDAALEAAGLLNADERAAAQSGVELIWTLLFVWIAVTVSLTALVLIAERSLNRHVSVSLKDLTAQMSKLASGDKDVLIPGKDRKDEIGEMARAMAIFHRAGLRLERLSRERTERAKAELEEQSRVQEAHEEARLERERVLQDVATQFERTIGDVVSNVAAASSQLHSTSETMAGTAETTSQRTSEVAQSMGEANRGATAAASASDEFAMSIGEISRQAASSADLARKATSSAEEADATISALTDSADQVGQIVELIQTIAQRTNLLALNASIEAARGGEAGRGFAVVASEVKELAMQTSRATEEIAEQIRGMQSTTGASVAALRTIADQVQQLEITSVSIASAVDQQSVAGQELARSIELAARETERVTGHIDDVHDLSLSTGTAATQVLASATDLEVQASTLRSQVDQFLEKVRRG